MSRRDSHGHSRRRRSAVFCEPLESRRLCAVTFASGTITATGESLPLARPINDSFRIRLGVGGTTVQVWQNRDLAERPNLTVSRSIVREINVNGGDGDDLLLLDSSNGLIDFGGNGISYDGGSGANQLRLEGPQVTSTIVLTGANGFENVSNLPPGSGTIQLTIASNTQAVKFRNLAASSAGDAGIVDLVPSETLSFSAPLDRQRGSSISLTDGTSVGDGVLRLLDAGLNGAVYDFANKRSLSIGTSNLYQTLIPALDPITGPADTVSVSVSEQTSLTDLAIGTGAGSDTVIIRSLPASVAATVDTSEGADLVQIRTSAAFGILSAPTVRGSIRVNGGQDPDRLDLNTLSYYPQPVDRLVIDDSASSLGKAARLKSRSLSGLTDVPLVFDSLESMAVQLGSGSDTFLVHTLFHMDLSIGGGAGDDLLALGAGTDGSTPTGVSVLDDIYGAIDFQGGAGNDLLVADDSGDLNTNNGTITVNSLSGMGLAKPVHFDSISCLTLFCGTGNDYISNQTNKTIKLRIELGPGDLLQ